MEASLVPMGWVFSGRCMRNSSDSEMNNFSARESMFLDRESMVFAEAIKKINGYESIRCLFEKVP